MGGFRRKCHVPRRRFEAGCPTGRPERGASLAGLLVVILMLGVMAATTIVAVSELAPRDPTEASLLQLSGLSGATGRSAAQVSCLADYGRVLLADKAYAARTGSGAATIAALVEAGDLSKPPSTSRGYTIGLASAAGKPTGAVTVDGVPGVATCEDL